jgi:feruloyl-CoA synthase
VSVAAPDRAQSDMDRLFARPEIVHERRPDGSTIVRSSRGLGSVPRSLGTLLERWAANAPSRVLLAERDATGAWRKITYEETARATNAIAQSLLDRGRTGRC